MMEHDQVVELLPAYVDQELGVSETIQIERHLNNCFECQQDFEQQSQLSAQLKSVAFHFEAPAGLAQRISDALPTERSIPAVPTDKRWQFGERFGWHFDRFNMGALLATLVAVLWSGSMFLSTPSAQDQLTDEIVASHVRSLQVDHLSDVISTDRHTVKPWFNGKLNFSPPVFDLASQGYPLTGGRLDYINGRPVAALIYHHQLHPINLYIWPTSDHNAAPVSQTRQGYHLVYWTIGGMTYWAVSDVAAADLTTFETLLTSQIRQAG